MARNRSLDDFLDPESGTEPDDATDATDAMDDADADTTAGSDCETDATDANDTDPVTDTLDPASELDAGPATSTMAWDPDGAACEACGTIVERRWRHDDSLVCDDCKEW